MVLDTSSVIKWVGFMIISCNECLKRYLIDPISLGETGRVVRCSSCGHAWHQNPPEDMPKVLETAMPIQKTSCETPENIHLSASFSETIPSSPHGFEQTQYEPLTARISPTQPRSLFSGLSAGFLVGFFLFGLLAFLYFGRFYVLEVCPSFSRLYDAVGIKTNSLAQHLELENVSWAPGVDDNQNPVFVLKGYILNSSQKAVAIPPLSVVFVSDAPQEKGVEKKCSHGECIIDRWIAHTSSDRILPGEVYPFQITLNKKIPADATNLYVEFVRP